MYCIRRCNNLCALAMQRMGIDIFFLFFSLALFLSSFIKK